MPTYQYICEKCGHEFDMYQAMSDRTLTACPKEHCSQKKWGKGKVKRLIGAGAGLIFKGSGFYITDHRSDSYKQAAKKDTAPATAGDSKPATKEAKPAPAKTESKKAPVTAKT